MIELVDPSKNYEIKHPDGAVFVMAHWTVAMQDEVDSKCIARDAQGRATYLLPLERELKIEMALRDWRGVGSEGAELPCTPENKRKLPVGVLLWLLQEIDERAGLRIRDSEKKT